MRVLATSCKPMREKLNLMNEVSFTSGEGMMAMNHVNDDSAVKDAWSVTTGSRKTWAKILSFFKDFRSDATS